MQWYSPDEKLPQHNEVCLIFLRIMPHFTPPLFLVAVIYKAENGDEKGEFYDIDYFPYVIDEIVCWTRDIEPPDITSFEVNNGRN